MMRTACFAVCTLLCLFTVISMTGCSNGKVPLGGKITFSDDGTPLPSGGIILFNTPSFTARGVIREGGVYTVASTGEKDGLPPGEYVVTVTNVLGTIKDAKGNDEVVELIDPKYGSERQSGLSITVDGKNRVYNIQVDRAKR